MTNYVPECLLTRLDYPDPDIIRVGETYYLVSTTMYYMPGAEILRSYDLLHWEHAAFVYDRLDSTPRERLDGGNIYGQGMWAPCFRYHNGTFYVSFTCNNSHKTYLYSSESIEGPWRKSIIEGFYYDSSILFDDDGRVYIVHGNRHVWVTELKPDLSGPLPGGKNANIFNDSDKPGLGYEGHHIYKMFGKYYVYSIHSRSDRWKRTEACHVCETIDGAYEGRDIFDEDIGFFDAGVAQGGIIDTPSGNYFMILFQDRGAAGRIPVLVPAHFENDFPVLKTFASEDSDIVKPVNMPFYEYSPLFGSDNFTERGPSFGLKSWWEFNHEPTLELVKIDHEKGIFGIETANVVNNLTEAKNTIGMRIPFPGATGEITVDVSKLGEGDRAGIAILCGCYGELALERENGKLYAKLITRDPETAPGVRNETYNGIVKDSLEITGSESSITLSVDAVFLEETPELKQDYSKYYVYINGERMQVGGEHKLRFTLDHFTGCRFGLFCYSTKKAGAKAEFSNFRLTEI